MDKEESISEWKAAERQIQSQLYKTSTRQTAAALDYPYLPSQQVGRTVEEEAVGLFQKCYSVTGTQHIVGVLKASLHLYLNM